MFNVNPASAGQVVVSGAQTRLSELTQGQLYRVTVTSVLPGKAEILIGNQYLLAATQLKFQPGDVITLKLAERTPELLRFQLALPGLNATAGVENTAEQQLQILLRAAGLADSEANRTLLTLLVGQDVALSGRSLSEVAQLLQHYPPEVLAQFMPLYKELLKRQISLDSTVLRQLVWLNSAEPRLAALLLQLPAAQRHVRQRSEVRKSGTGDTFRTAIFTTVDEASLPSAAQLRDSLHLLYGSPEAALQRLLRNFADEEGEPSITAGKTLVLRDLANLVPADAADAATGEILALLQAIRVSASLEPRRFTVFLPLLLERIPTEIKLSLALLAEQFYQKDYLLRMQVSNELQGDVAITVRTRGNGLSVDIRAGDPQVRSAYQAQLDQLRAELEQDHGFVIRHLSAGGGA